MPAFSLQANLVDDRGLMICVAFHHTAFDGRSIIVLMRDLAGFLKSEATPETVQADVDALIRYKYSPTVAEPLQYFPKYFFDGVASLPPPSTNAVSRILTFNAPKLAALKQEISAQMATRDGAENFVSTADCLSGLIWTAVTQARYGRLRPEETLKWHIAMNARERLGLTCDYLGNAVFHTVATAEASELVTTDTGLSTITIATAATRIRQAVQAVDTHYIHQRLALLSSLLDPTIVTEALKARLDRKDTGLDPSDWREQGADFDFGIPGTVRGKPDWVRKTWSAWEGAVNFMPRQGGARGGDANWEVLLALSVPDMEATCRKLAAGGWIERVVQSSERRKE